GLNVVLRRLANPYIPWDNRPSISGIRNDWYNPFVSTDYMDKNPLQSYLLPTGQTVLPPYASRGKMEPFAGSVAIDNTTSPTTTKVLQKLSLVQEQSAQHPAVAPYNTLTHVTSHTFGNPSATLNPFTPLDQRYHWLAHLDRQLISPVELLQVA